MCGPDVRQQDGRGPVACKEAHGARRRHRRGRPDGQQGPRPSGGRPTRSLQIKKTRTSANYGAAWRLRIEPRCGRSPVRRIRPGHIDDWIADMVEQGTSASKVIESVGVLKRVLDPAVRDRAVVANPCALGSSPLPRRPKIDRPVLTPAEVERLASAMREEVERVLVRLHTYCGLRIGEALALQRGNVDLEHRTRTVRRSVEDTSGTIVVGPTKTCATRTITLPDALVPELTGLADRGLLFPNPTVGTGATGTGVGTSGIRHVRCPASSRCPTTCERPVRAC